MVSAEIGPSGTIRALRVLIIAALIIPTLIFATTAWRDRRAILVEEEADAVKLLAVFHEQADSLFKGHNIILDLIAERMRNRDWETLQRSPEILHELESFDKMLDDTSAILLVDAAGQTRATTLRLRDNEPLPSGDEACFRALQRGATKTCVSDPSFDPVSGEHLFSLTRSLEKDGIFYGMAQVAISADYIMALWATALPRPTDTISLVRSDGVILAQPTSHPEAAYAAIGASLIKKIEERGSNFSPTRLTAARDDGNLVFRKITNYPAYIGLGLDLKAILAEWYRHLAIYGLTAVGAALGIVLALRFALKRAHEERRAVAELQREMHERESAQEQLRQIDRAQEIAGIGGWELNIASGRYTWSRQHYRIHGLPLDHQPTSENLMSSLHTDDVRPLSDWLINLQAGREREPIEIRINRPEGGEMRVLRLDGRSIIDPDGVIRRLTGTTQDVTERRLIQRQLMQAQKMEAIGNLTGGMAHDFNNLLGVIILNLGVAQKMLPGSDRARQLVVDALGAARSGADLIRSLLAFARRQPLRPSRIEINEQVSNMFSLLSRVVREDIEISLDLSPNLWPVIADPAQFEACIVNLATNSRDAMPNGGKLTIVTGNQHLDADYAKVNPSVTPGDYAMITISDTGTGMTAEVIAKVFDPFFTTKEQGKGTGLGLSMVFGFTNQSGGHVSIYSEPGLGTTIRLFLPRAADTAEPRVPAHSPSSIAAEKGRGETVLVVEDNVAMRQAVVQQLVLLNYRVLESASAPAALAMLANERIDLVFSDVVMPGGMDGFDLAERVGRQWPAVRVLMTSGFLPGTARVRSDGPASSSRFISKPYDLEQLTRAVRETLDA